MNVHQLTGLFCFVVFSSCYLCSIYPHHFFSLTCVCSNACLLDVYETSVLVNTSGYNLPTVCFLCCTLHPYLPVQVSFVQAAEECILFCVVVYEYSRAVIPVSLLDIMVPTTNWMWKPYEDIPDLSAVLVCVVLFFFSIWYNYSIMSILDLGQCIVASIVSSSYSDARFSSVKNEFGWPCLPI